MNKSEILAFLRDNPAFYLATAEGNNPHVRGLLLYRADENGIVFQTWKTKDIHQQLSENPRVELCFNNYQGISHRKISASTQIRVSGLVELVEDLELKKEILSKRPFLKALIQETGYELAIYRLRKGVAAIWTMENNFAPKNYIEL